MVWEMVGVEEDSQISTNGGQNCRSGRQTPTCYNCGELGHISPHCDKSPIQGGDMYPLPTQLPNRSNDYGIEIKQETGSSGTR